MEGEGKEEKLPPGFRFHPTDEELITYYLINKINDSDFTSRAVGDVNLNNCEPWDLPGKAKMGEKVWYFFSLRDRKYPTGVRTNRATNTGYWKTTGKDKEIYDVGVTSSETVGMKKTLVFYRGRAPRGEKTSWVMHEYRIHAKSSYRTAKDEWVVCRVFQKSVGVKKYPSTHSRALHPYNLDIGSSTMASQMMMQQNQHPDAYQFPMGRNYMSHAEMEQLSRVYRGATATSGAFNFPFQSQTNYPVIGGTAFSVSGLDLNIRGGANSTQQQVLRPAPSGINQQDILMSSSMMTNGVIANDPGNYASIEDMGNANAIGGRYVGMDQCGDLDPYWTSY